MSVRRLNGWEPAEVTSFVYEGDRLVRTVSVREPEFTAAETAVLLASRRREFEAGPHGVPMQEATDPANQFAFKGKSGPVVDWAEKARLDAQEAWRKANPDANTHGHIWAVERR